MELHDQERAGIPEAVERDDESSHPVQVSQLAPVAGVSAAITAWLAVLGLVTTPIMLHTLGAAAYAVFALITIMTSYLSNLELGFGNTTLRFLARARAMGDNDAEFKIVGTSLFVFSCAGALAAAVAFFGAPVIATSFANFPPELEGAADGAIRLAALVLILTFFYSFAQVSLQALGKFRPLLWSRLAAGTLLSGAGVGTAVVFEDVRAVLVASVIVSLLTCVALFPLLGKALSAPVRPSFDVPTFREMAGFGGIVFATGLAYQAMMQGPPTVLAGLAPAHELAAFAVAAVVFQQIVLLTRAASTAFLPFASAEGASDDRERLAAVFLSHLRLTVTVIGPVAGFLIVFAEPMLTLWLGADFAAEIADPLRLLAVAGFLLAVSTPAADVAHGVGRPGWNLAFNLAAGGIGITATVLLAGRSGADGAALGLLIGVSVVTPAFLLLTAERLVGQSPLRLAASVAGPVLGMLALVGVYVLSSLAVGGLAGAVVGGAFTFPYAIANYRFVLDERERRTLKGGTDSLASSARSFTALIAGRPRRKMAAAPGSGPEGMV